MTQEARVDTRARLLAAAADMIAASPGEEVSLRAICERVGVKMPTLYHFFGSKQGLLEAVIKHGFDLYLAEKSAHESTGDPIQDLRDGWDAHVAFGLANPGFYTLMYGTVRPGYSPAPQERPSEILRDLAQRAADHGRLAVPADQAAAHVLVANIGVTLRQIVLGVEDRQLSIAVREGCIAAITGAAVPAPTTRRADLLRVLDYVNANQQLLGVPESALLVAWLRQLADQPD